ncbi:MAG: alpha/beta hydrolase [Bryobacteraceae bacterium]|jgi:alpha-beta hydrolase superfamily lysophospholipase
MDAKRIALLACLICAGVAMAWWIAGTILVAPWHEAIGSMPADLPGSDVKLASGSGETLRGWFVPASAGHGAVVLMHGVRASRLSMLARARFLHDEGFSVLLCDFQAHGESTAHHITFGYLESRDARAEVRLVRQRAAGEKVGVIGVSLGGAATVLASPPLDVDAMVLESVYPTVDEAVSDRLTARLRPWASLLTPLLTTQLRLRFGFGPEQLRPIDRVPALRVPRLFIAGTADRSTTIRESERLFQAAAEPKELWEIRGAGHEDLYAYAGAEYRRRVVAFLNEHLR